MLIFITLREIWIVPRSTNHRGQLFPDDSALCNIGTGKLSPGKLAPIFVQTGFRGPLQFVTSCQIFSFISHPPDFREYGGEEEQVIKIVEDRATPPKSEIERAGDLWASHRGGRDLLISLE